MNLQRREEIREMCAEPARGGTQGAKQIFDLRDAIGELFAHIDALEQTAAERVIADGKALADRVPGEGVAALRRFAERCAQRDHQPDEHIGSAKCVACEAEDALRAIPADRVLVDGMVQVERDYARCALQAIEHLISRHVSNCATLPDIGWRKARRALRDALRANQGGAAT